MQILTKIPVAWTVTGILAGAALAGGTTALLLRDVLSLPARVEALETWKTGMVEPGMRFLVCSQKAINEGRDPRMCDVVLQGLSEMLAMPGPR